MQKLVGVLGVLHAENLYLNTHLFQHGNGTLGGALAGLVAIISKHNLLRIAAQQCGMLFRQAGTQ